MKISIGACFVLFALYAIGLTIDKIEQGGNDIDLLNKSVNELKASLKPETVLSFESNVVEEQRGVLYFRTQFVMAPNVLRERSHPGDTTIFIERSNSPSINLNHYNVVREYPSDNLKIILAVKR